MKRAFDIVLVDEHPIMFHALNLLFERTDDLRVIYQASSAREFLRWLEHGHADLIMLEMFLGNSDALEMVKTVRTLRPRQRMLVFSGLNASEYAQRVLAAGAHGYVMKSQPVDDVPRAVRTVLHGRVYLPESVALSSAHPSILPDGGQRLTDREFSIFNLLGRGLSTREIAESLNISRKTVEKHRENIKEKLGIRNAAKLLSEAGRWVDRAGAGTLSTDSSEVPTPSGFQKGHVGKVGHLHAVAQSKSAAASHA